MLLLLAIGFVAGVVTALSPCVLPVLPIVLAGGATGRRPLAIVAGIVLSFTVFTLFAAWLLDHGDSWGAAFPSSHVAASVVATGMALRYWRPVGLVLLPFTAGLILAVVYGQFHYAADALAGLMVAALMLGIMQTAEASEPRRVTVGDYHRVESGSGV